jgi:serine/alanine adding enzyme
VSASRGVGDPAVRIEPVNVAPEGWDELARASTGSSHHHLYGWRRIMEDVLGHECVYLAASEDGKLVGILPLVRVKSVVFGHYLVSMPFLNYGGPLGSDAAVSALAREATRMAESEGVKLLELRARESIPLDLRVSHRKITVVLDIPAEGSATLFKKLDSKLRSQVRRPAKEGVTYQFGADQVDPFFDVFSHHMRDLGTPTQSREFFRRIADEFPDSSWFGCAWLAGRPIACGCGFRWSSEFEMTWASSLREFNRTSANMGLYWAFMERAAADGATTFNFGRCTPGSGTHRFKRQWGGRDEQLWWYQLSRDRDAEGAATPSPDAGVWSLGPRMWRHLPVGLANALGPRIVRFIP